MKIDLNDYPALNAERHWPEGRWHFELFDRPPHPELIANVNLVPFAGDRFLVLRFNAAAWEIPGGTLEPGENYLETIHREVLEEAGAMVLNFTLFGGFRMTSLEPGPYRPHLPYPINYRLVGFGDVQIAAAPTDGGSRQGKTTAVDLVDLPEAERRFRSIDRPDIAELYRMASVLRSRSG